MKNCLEYDNMCNGIYEYYCLIDIYMNKLVEVCEEKKIIYFGKQFVLKNIFFLNLNGFNGSYYYVKNNLIMFNFYFRFYIFV